MARKQGKEFVCTAESIRGKWVEQQFYARFHEEGSGPRVILAALVKKLYNFFDEKL